jgi:hypothetical protein
MEQTKKRGRPRVDNKEPYTAIVVSKTIRKSMDDFMFDNRLKLSYSKLIDYLFTELDKSKTKILQIEKFMENFR